MYISPSFTLESDWDIIAFRLSHVKNQAQFQGTLKGQYLEFTEKNIPRKYIAFQVQQSLSMHFVQFNRQLVGGFNPSEKY